MSDKPFRENTPNALMPATPEPAQHETIEASIADLGQSITELFDAFRENPDLQVSNPFFGVLDEEQTMNLLYKHSLHHLKQFGVSVL